MDYFNCLNFSNARKEFHCSLKLCSEDTKHLDETKQCNPKRWQVLSLWWQTSGYVDRSQSRIWNFLFLSRCLASCLLGLSAWRTSHRETRGHPEYGYLSTVNHRKCQQDMQTGKRDTAQIKKQNITLQVSMDSSFVLPSRCTVTIFQPQQIHNKHQEWQLHVSAVTAKEK